MSAKLQNALIDLLVALGLREPKLQPIPVCSNCKPTPRRH